MAKRKKKKRSRLTKKSIQLPDFFKNERVHFILGIVVAFIGIFMLLAIVSFFFTGAADQSKVNNLSFLEIVKSQTVGVENWTGAGGAYIAERFVNGGFGISSILISFFLIYVGLRLMKVSELSFMKTLFLTAFGLVGGSITTAFLLNRIFPDSHIKWGGTYGNRMEELLQNSIGWPGIIMLIILIVIIIVVTARKSSIDKIQNSLIKSKSQFAKENQSPGPIDLDDPSNGKSSRGPGFIKRLIAKAGVRLFNKKGDGDQTVYEEETLDSEKSSNRARESIKDGDFEVIIPTDDEPGEIDRIEEKRAVRERSDDISQSEYEDYEPRKDLPNYRHPTLDLLKVYSTGNREVNMIEQTENKDKIINTLRNYGIEITSIKATVGPTITLYEIVPEAGVRISKIRNLEDDIALSLSALGIRIIAPIPGKGTIGIEVPNKEPQIVSMHSVLSSKKFIECDYELPVALGKTITNEVFMFDLTKMPHLLVSGATGQGKSVGLNAIIASLLYKKHPAIMKMVLIDPKMVEFNLYTAIEKHFLAKLPDEEKPIITDVSKVTQTLNSLTKEMDDRYGLLMKAHVRTIGEYNEKFIKRRLNPNRGHKFLPYIVVVIDEFGDLIMTAGKEIEMPIARIAQKARAVGIHMVIATQRPTTNIITGTIKANFPARMAFRVTSQIDSRTILDMSGANQLVGRGDMLFSQGSILTRIQGAFVDTPELDEITKFIAKQQGYESAHPLPEVLTDGEDVPGAVDLNERDVLFEEAARLIVVHQQGSTSLIQRKFSIGYNRAGRLMDQLEAAGIVSAAQGSKPREVFIQDEYSLEKIFNSLN